MSQSTSDEKNDGVFLLIIAGFAASFFLVAGLVLFAGLHFFRGLEVTSRQVGTKPADLATEQTASIEPELPIATARGSVEFDSEPADQRLRRKESSVRLVGDGHSIQPSKIDAAKSRGTSPRYAWKPDEKLVYDFDITAKVGSRKLTYRGRNSIQPTGKRPTFPDEDGGVDQGSGTGFVIHPNGIVVTCAHVVKGAQSIKATVGGKTFNATVTKMDTANDLAIVQLDTEQLPFLKFANSDRVRLGQDVRAIGYPLSDVLGKSIKVTKGEVSGRGGPGGTDGLQIDATINPGNSGGPLVDSSGRLVGVTSSMLAGIGISEVGFAVPSNKVIELADELSIAIEIQDESRSLSAPDIVDLIRPSTVLLEVNVGPGGIGMELPHQLKFSGHWYETTIPTPGSFLPSGLQHRNFGGKIDVTSSGESIRDDPNAMLPLLLGSISRVGIEPLPTSAPGREVSTQRIVIQNPEKQQRRSAFDPFGFGNFGRRHRPPWMRKQTPATKELKKMLGSESTTMVLEQPTKDGISLRKTYSLIVDGESGDEPPLIVSGTGNGVFDHVDGRMLKMKYTLSIKVHDENVTLRIPVTMNYKLVDQETLAEERLANEARKIKRAAEKANATPTTTKKSTFRSPGGKSTRAAGPQKYESVKNAPESSSLRKFNFNK